MIFLYQAKFLDQSLLQKLLQQANSQKSWKALYFQQWIVPKSFTKIINSTFHWSDSAPEVIRLGASLRVFALKLQHVSCRADDLPRIVRLPGRGRPELRRAHGNRRVLHPLHRVRERVWLRFGFGYLHKILACYVQKYWVTILGVPLLLGLVDIKTQVAFQYSTYRL